MTSEKCLNTTIIKEAVDVGAMSNNADGLVQMHYHLAQLHLCTYMYTHYCCVKDAFCTCYVVIYIAGVFTLWHNIELTLILCYRLLDQPGD